jgi:ethanolamine utilization protein EutA (predicted chaperonin)
MSDEAGGRIFFSNIGRSLEEEDEVRLVSVGIDIGSSTSHLVFSRLVLERLDDRYVVVAREILHESEVLLTPYADDRTIDADRLGAFIERQYRLAGQDPHAIDTGALILTGVAVRRRNARAIGELFAQQAGKFVAVSAGDGLEATLAAFGSGAVARSIREGRRVMNVDIGGGTSKIAVCEGGEIVDLTAADIGARVICFDEAGRVSRIEEAGRRFASEAGVEVAIGSLVTQGERRRIAECMADHLFEAMKGGVPSRETAGLLRLPALREAPYPDTLTFSGGLSEYIYGRETTDFGDLGPLFARAVEVRMAQWGVPVEAPVEGIRATVVGASQYTIQVSGSTIFVTPLDVLPLRNVPVVRPPLPLGEEALSADAIADAVRFSLRRLDLHASGSPVAVGYSWDGSATFGRLDAFCRGVAAGMAEILSGGHPLVLVGDGDVGGLIGIHCHEETRLQNPVVSIDGVTLNDFDFIDIGAFLEVSGAVPVVIKSLVFPASAALGRGEGHLAA